MEKAVEGTPHCNVFSLKDWIVTLEFNSFEGEYNLPVFYSIYLNNGAKNGKANWVQRAMVTLSSCTDSLEYTLFYCSASISFFAFS